MQRSQAIAVVTRETRLEGLLARWGTAGAAKFRLKAAHAHERMLSARGPVDAAATDAGQDDKALAEAAFEAYEAEDRVYRATLDRIADELDLGFPVTHVRREYVANYDFRNCVVVVVVGQDGLVANTAKYVGDVPIVAVNPDPTRIDGVLLPFDIGSARQAVQGVIRGTAAIREVTLAEAELNDGQRLLAFNDLFIGSSSHTSARYTLTVEGRSEPQSSSGMIVSTGAGSTGWLSSLFNMYDGFGEWLRASNSVENMSASPPAAGLRLGWEDPRLAWAVREPFLSKQSGASLVAGLLEEGEEIVVESLMPSRGVIFSDGVESDFLEFQSGSIARIRRAQQRARLVG